MLPDLPDTPAELAQRLVLAALFSIAIVGLYLQANRLGRRLGGERNPPYLPPAPHRSERHEATFSSSADEFLHEIEVEQRAKALHYDSCSRRGVEPRWEGRGTNRGYWRRLARKL